MQERLSTRAGESLPWEASDRTLAVLAARIASQMVYLQAVSFLFLERHLYFLGNAIKIVPIRLPQMNAMLPLSP